MFGGHHPLYARTIESFSALTVRPVQPILKVRAHHFSSERSG